ncbi:hypothetical protein SDC9_122219 [bioreactor metagenome]|uniref:Uncharacterized protein n=1 Tax=bioreactor metagenome TaxID=1076179 RepID=A0A645CE98_9ZZZZ
MKMRRLLGAVATLVVAMSSTLASADSKTLSIGYVDGWSDSVATTHVAAEVIKAKLGYDVKLQAVATGIMWQGVATGKLDAMLKVHARLAEGALVGVLADRSLGDEARVPVELLGSPAMLPLGPFRMAAMLDAPVLFMAGLYHGGNRYTIRFAPIADFSTVPRAQRDAAIHDAMHRYATVLAQCCREAPSNWFNFFDFWNDFDTAKVKPE